MAEPYEGTQLWHAAKAIHQQLNEPLVELLFGRNAIEQHQRKNCIIWVRPGGIINPPGQGGGLYRSPEEVIAEAAMVPTGKPVAAPNGTRVQWCFDPIDSAVAHLYAETDLQLERLFYRLLAAIKLACGQHGLPGRYMWSNELDGGLTKRQPKMELQVQFTFAAPEEISALTLITSTIHTHDFNDGDEGGEGTHT